MISFQQIRSFFVTVSLSVLLATTMAFGLGMTDSLAANSPTKLVSQPQTQIATVNKSEPKNLGEKVQEVIDNMTGNSQAETKTEAPLSDKKLKAKTQEALNNSIENPDYQPSGKTDQAKDEDQQLSEDMKDQASEFLN